MPETRSSAAHASVVHLRVAGFALSGAAERAGIKKDLEGAVSAALAGIDEADRIVLDAPEGMALVFLAGAPAALGFVHRFMSREAKQLPAIGLSHGPVRCVEDATTGPSFVGGALSEAMIAARFATAGSGLATRSFRDALARVAPHDARYLSPAGTMTDDRDRAFELFHAERELMGTRRRRFFTVAASLAVGMLVVGGAGRAFRMRRPGVVELDITPGGELFVNGVSRGQTPPLKMLQLPPGKYELEVRNARYKPLTVDLELQPGERINVSHAFGSASPASRRSFKQRVFDLFK